MSSKGLSGLIAAPYTPFDSHGDLNLPVIERQVEQLVRTGVKGAFVCGTTGEGLSLTVAERMAVAKRWVEVAGKTLKVIVHVGHNCQRDAIELARHAGQSGAFATAALAPSFFKPTTVDQVVEFMRPIAAAGGQLPFYYYHIPSMTGVLLPMLELLQVGGERIPNLRGIKFTHGDLMEYLRCQRYAEGEYEIAWGVDEFLLGALTVGATAAVGSTYNYAAGLYGKMISAHQAGDLETARLCAARSADMVALLFKYGGLRTGKATMAMIGVDCGPPRAPLMPLNADEIEALERAYERIGFFDWSNSQVRTTRDARTAAVGNS